MGTPVSKARATPAQNTLLMAFCFTISLKRSTQNLQLSTTTPADYPIVRG